MKLNYTKIKAQHKPFSALLVAIFAFIIITAGSALAQNKQETPFPSIGSGPVEVRLYTDYFCPPCRAMESDVEPILLDLLKKKIIRLTLVDVPFNHLTPLYARHALYALKSDNSMENAFRVRNALIEAAIKGDVANESQMETFLKAKGILLTVFDTKPIFNRYNELVREDKIRTTPTCIIVKNGKKSEHVNRNKIVKALRGLQ